MWWGKGGRRGTSLNLHSSLSSSVFVCEQQEYLCSLSMVNKSLIKAVSKKFHGLTCCGLSAAIVTVKFCYDSIKPVLVCKLPVQFNKETT